MSDARDTRDAREPRPSDESEAREPSRVSLPIAVCRKLRTKTGFGSRQPGAPDWRAGESSTAVYWCLSTMETWGPDQSVAHAQSCRAGRTCYVAPEDTGGVA